MLDDYWLRMYQDDKSNRQKSWDDINRSLDDPYLRGDNLYNYIQSRKANPRPFYDSYIKHSSGFNYPSIPDFPQQEDYPYMRPHFAFKEPEFRKKMDEELEQQLFNDPNLELPSNWQTLPAPDFPQTLPAPDFGIGQVTGQGEPSLSNLQGLTQVNQQSKIDNIKKELQDLYIKREELIQSIGLKKQNEEQLRTAEDDKLRAIVGLGLAKDYAKRELGLDKSEDRIKGSQAFAEFTKAKNDFFQARSSGNTELANQAMDRMATASSKYYDATGKVLNLQNYSTILNAESQQMKAEKSKIDIKKGEQDLQKGELDIKTKTADLKAKAVKMVNDAVDSFVDYRKKPLEELQKIQQSISLFNQVKGDDPATLFTTVKLLAQLIEPGLAVTEGEVKGFSGDSTVSEMVTLFRQIFSTMSQIIPGFKNKNNQSLEQAAKAVDPMTVKQIRDVFTALAATTQTVKQNAVKAGQDEIMKAISNDVNVTFGESLTEDIINTINSNIKQKLDAYLNTGATNISVSTSDKKPDENKPDENKPDEKKPEGRGKRRIYNPATEKFE